MVAKKHGKFRFHDFEVDLAKQSLRRDGRAIAIGPRGFDLLGYFLRNPQRVVSKDEIIESLWPYAEAEEVNLGQHIFLLRKALTGKELGDKLLANSPGRGYRFTAEVEEIHDEKDAEKDAEDDAHDRQMLKKAATVPERRIRFEAGPVAPLSVEASLEHNDGSEESQEEKPPVRAFAGFSRTAEPQKVAGKGAVSIGVALFALVVLAGSGWFYWQRQQTPPPASLTVLFAGLENSTGNTAFDPALEQALTIDLQQSPFLQIVQQDEVDTVANTLKHPAQPGGLLDPDTARAVCQRLHGEAFLTASVHKVGHEFAITLRAEKCTAGTTIAANLASTLAKSTGLADTPDGVMRVLDRVTLDLRRQLGESAASVQKFSKPLFPGHIGSLQALEAYAQASHLAQQGKLADALPLYHRAIELEPQFTLAYAYLGGVYADMGQSEPAASNLNRAYELRDTVDARNRHRITHTYHSIVTGNLMASIRNDKEWRQDYPLDSTPLLNLGQLEIEIGAPALALEAGQSAIKLSPDNPKAYALQAQAQMSLGQFEEAGTTCQQAITRKIDDESIHAILLQIGFHLLDQPAIDQQIAWAKGTPAEPEMQLLQGRIHFASGQAKAAEEDYNAAIAAFRAKGQNARADRIAAEMPRILAELGEVQAAHTLLTHLPDAETGTDVAVAWAHVGETKHAEALLKQDLDTYASATLWPDYFAAQIRAAIALNQHQPKAAIEALQSAEQFDLRSFEGPALRGRAYLVAQQPEDAESQFHKILDHPGIDPLSYDYSLAELGLARSLAAQKKLVDAVFAYKIVLEIWKEADPDLPRYVEAKAEYARLSGQPVRGGSASAKSSSAKSSSAKPAPSKPAQAKPTAGKPSLNKPKHK
jgi:DNA-binding winged helix-turn-helix (wHTH) protein/tetratricopeptide (TPR) repeat protein